MSAYSKQLIAELAENLDPIIVTFFDESKEDNNYPVDTLNELVEYTLEDMVGVKTSKDELRIVYTNEMKNRRKKKARWLDKLEDSVEHVQPSDPKHPFFDLYSLQQLLPKAQWKSLYGNKTLTDLINSNVEIAREWGAQANSYFIAFPALKQMSKARIFESLVSDTFIWIFQYVLEHYDGSIINYFTPILDDLIGVPLFSPGKSKLSVSLNEEDELVDSYVFGENVLETTTDASTGVSVSYNAMDQNDLMFLQKSLTHLDIEFYNTRQVRMKKRTLAKILNDRPSKKHYDSMEEHCHKLAKYNFTVKKNGKVVHTFNLIDSVISDDENDEMILTFGNYLYNGIIQNQITNTKSSVYQLLDKNLSTILYQALFKEVIIFSTKNTDPDAELVGDYTYAFFNSNVRFPYQQKKKNMDLVAESLEEFYQKHLLIKSYERTSPLQFRITFFPLTEDERADLDFNRYNKYVELPENAEQSI